MQTTTISPLHSPLTVERALAILLEGSHLPAALAPKERYARVHDDSEGKRDVSQELSVVVGPEGDVLVASGMLRLLRFKPQAAGGMSPRVRNALLVLAEAIRRDNEETPQVCEEPQCMQSSR